MSEKTRWIGSRPSLNPFGLIMGVGAGGGAWLVLDNIVLGVAVGVVLAFIFSSSLPSKKKHRSET